MRIEPGALGAGGAPDGEAQDIAQEFVALNGAGAVGGVSARGV